MRRLRRVGRALLLAGTSGAVAATVHTAYNLRRLQVPRTTPPGSAVPVSVLVPARDEAARIGACLSALRAQQGVVDLEILVLDDRSTDGTAQVVAHHVAADPRVRLVDAAGEPPAGWHGKAWACRQLAAAADGQVLVFVDADVVVSPQAIAATLDTMRTTGLDAVSPYPRQVAVTTSERLVQPLLQWSWLTFLPLGPAERSPRESLVAANGQLLAIRADTYRSVGGYDSVAADVLDDVALFRAVKRAGGRAGVVDGTELATCRMYDGWPQLRDGYTKSLWAAFGSPAGAAGVAALLALLYVLPPAAALAGSRVGLLGYAAGVTGRVMVARRVRSRVWPDALGHPVSVATVISLTGASWRGRRRGTLYWKGRPLP